jgi:hypothetical protein
VLASSVTQRTEAVANEIQTLIEGGIIQPKMKSSPLCLKGISDTATLKEEIQDLVRAIVIARDGGCIFYNLQGHEMPMCNGYRKDGHLITRANSTAYADTRLIVCVCKDHHGWKRWAPEGIRPVSAPSLESSERSCGAGAKKRAGSPCALEDRDPSL